MDLSGLSSNWKELQARLKEEKGSSKSKHPSATPSNGVSKHRRLRSSKPSKTAASKASTTRPGPPTTLSAPIASTTNIKDSLNGGLTSDVAPGKYVALDCEMVGVGPPPHDRSMLARASVVDYHGTQLYDSFVLPKEPVTDYRTAVSGITPALIAQGSGARSLEEVQKDVAMLLEGRILVAHAVKNDLKVLFLKHPASMTRDTSELRKYRDLVGGRRPKLRDLAKQVLGLDIQTGSHSSVEDARTTMALFRREKGLFESKIGEDTQTKSVGSRTGRRNASSRFRGRRGGKK